MSCILGFGFYFGKTVKQIGDSNEGLLYLDDIIGNLILDEELRREIIEYLAKNKVRLDVAMENKFSEEEEKE